MGDAINNNDVVLTKAGGLTCAESVSLNKPLIIFGKVSGQEKANTQFLVNNSVAIEVNSVHQLTRAINL